jgi:hypothetical protein
MLINSKFKDYYDQCASYGIDKTVQYHRVSQTLNAKDTSGPDGQLIKAISAAVERARLRLTPPHRDVDLFFVGFCGKIYAGFTANVLIKTGRIKTNSQYVSSLRRPLNNEPDYTVKYFWEATDLDKQDRKIDINARSWLSLDCPPNPSSVKTVEQWIDYNADVRENEALELFIDHKLVSFVYDQREITLNPCLHDYNFQRVIGGVEAFQAIDMFISGVLGQPANPMIELTDKDRIQAHGFDNKSFRKDPTKHK